MFVRGNCCLAAVCDVPGAGSAGLEGVLSIDVGVIDGERSHYTGAEARKVRSLKGDRLDAKRAAPAARADSGTPLACAGVGALLRAAPSEIKTPNGRSSWRFGQQRFRPPVLPHTQNLPSGAEGFARTTAL